MRVPGFGGARKGQPEQQQQRPTGSEVFPEGTTRLAVWTTGSGEKTSSWKIEQHGEKYSRTEMRQGDSHEGTLWGVGLMCGAVIANVEWTQAATERGTAWLGTQLSHWRSSVATAYADRLESPYQQRNQR